MTVPSDAPAHVPAELQDALAARLAMDRNVWLCARRPDGPPHVTPVWFVWDGHAVWMCTSSTTAKARLLARDPRVSLALEDGDRPIVGEGRAVLHRRPYPEPIVTAFQTKYGWDITATGDPDGDFELLVEVAPERWLLLAP